LGAGNVAALAAAPAAPATIALVDQVADPADQTTYTFSSRALGAAASNRSIIVAVTTRNSSNISRSISSASIAGVSAAIIADGGGAEDNVAIIAANVPSGTTGDIVITFDGGTSRCGISVFRATDIDIATYQTDTYYSGGSTPTVPGDLSLNAYANGVAVGVACSADASGAPAVGLSWSGLTQEAQYNLELFSGVAVISARAASAQTTAETPRAVSINCTWSGTAFGIAGVTASFARAA
jgi:hypothetical protein